MSAQGTTGTKPSVNVSVVIPCYRCAETLGRALDSVFAQTTAPREIIVVNDGGDAPARECIDAVAAIAPAGLVRVLHLQRNLGAASARNTGWEAACGEYVAFLDADDSWHPLKLEVQHRFMQEHPEFVLTGHAHARRADEAERHARDGGWRPMTAEQLLWRNRFITPSVMVRRDLPLRFEEGRRHMEDHLLWMRVAIAGGRIAFLNASLAIIWKAQFGECGLSANLLEMEKAELENYRVLWRSRAFGTLKFVALSLWSIGKFARRLLVVAARRWPKTIDSGVIGRGGPK